MTVHEIIIEAEQNSSRLLVTCSCGEGLIGSRVIRLTAEQIIEIAREHMERTYPARLIEEMKRVPSIPVKDLGISDEEAIRLLGQKSKYIHGLDPADDDPRKNALG